MDILSLIILVSFVGFAALAVMLIYQFNRGMHQIDRSLSDKLNWITTQVRERIQDNSQSLQNASVELGSKLESAVKVVSDVHEHLGKLQESHNKIYELGKDITRLQDLLRAPKLRGGMGEFFLEDLLRQALPKDSFSFQYEFKSKERVDAIIKFGQGFVPIDSKFPLENFQKLTEAEDERGKTLSKRQFISDVKEHIKNISEKYIKPDEGTFDFALMYIPAENVYYETIIKDEKFEVDGGLFQYSLNKRVIPVSPNSFYAYLMVILFGLKGMAVEKGAKFILQNISKLRGELNRFCEDFTKIGKHLSNSRSSYELAEKHLNRFSDKLEQLESPAVTDEETPRIKD